MNQLELKFDIGKTFEQNLIMNDVDPVDFYKIFLNIQEYNGKYKQGGNPFTATNVAKAVLIAGAAVAVGGGVVHATYAVYSATLCNAQQLMMAGVFNHQAEICTAAQAAFDTATTLARGFGWSAVLTGLQQAGSLLFSAEQVELTMDQAQRIVNARQACSQNGINQQPASNQARDRAGFRNMKNKSRFVNKNIRRRKSIINKY
jgi:hypothetical protein